MNYIQSYVLNLKLQLVLLLLCTCTPDRFCDNNLWLVNTFMLSLESTAK